MSSPTPSAHWTDEEEVLLFLAGELGPEETRCSTEHLTYCEECREDLLRFRDFTRAPVSLEERRQLEADIPGDALFRYRQIRLRAEELSLSPAAAEARQPSLTGLGEVGWPRQLAWLRWPRQLTRLRWPRRLGGLRHPLLAPGLATGVLAVLALLLLQKAPRSPEGPSSVSPPVVPSAGAGGQALSPLPPSAARLAESFPLEVAAPLRLAQPFRSEPPGPLRGETAPGRAEDVLLTVERDLLELLGRQGDSAAVCNAVAHLKLARGRLARAREYYQWALDVDADSDAAHIGLAVVSYQQARRVMSSEERRALLEQADRNLAQVARTSPEFGRALFNRVEVALASGDVERAADLLRVYEESQREDGWMHTLRAAVQRVRGRSPRR